MARTADRKSAGKRAAYAIITRSLISEAGRFLPQQRGAALLARCRIAAEGEYCSTEYAPDDAIELLREYDEAMKTLQGYARYADDAELASLVLGLRKALRDEAAEVAQRRSRRDAGRLKDAFAGAGDLGDGPAFIDSVEADTIDVTGLEGRDASTFALLAKRWNPKIKRVYTWRNGKRYVTPALTRLDLNHPFVKAQPWYDDLLSVVRERNLPIRYEND